MAQREIQEELTVDQYTLGLVGPTRNGPAPSPTAAPFVLTRHQRAGDR